MKPIFAVLLASAVSCWAGLPAAKPGYTAWYSYRPTLLIEAAAAQAHGLDPLSAANTPQQRRFLATFYEIIHERWSKGIRGGNLLQATLERSGVRFPEGTMAFECPVDSGVYILHTPEGLKQIKGLMRLQDGKEGSPPTRRSK